MNMAVIGHAVDAATIAFARRVEPNLLEIRHESSIEDPAAPAPLPDVLDGGPDLNLLASSDDQPLDAQAQDAVEPATSRKAPAPEDSTADDPLAIEPAQAISQQGAFEFKLGVRMEMATTQDGLELTMELAGVPARDIEIDVCDDVLTVRGEQRRSNERPDRTYRMSDRCYGQFSRSIDLPKGVRPDKIKASLVSGLLHIFIPNPVASTSTKIHIQSPLTYLAAIDGVQEFAIAAPGLGDEDLDVEVAGGMLTISERPGRLFAGDETLSSPDGKALAIFRSIELPADVRADQITATLTRGILKVAIPNHANQQPQRVRVQAA